jgi:hypothetical protein
MKVSRSIKFRVEGDDFEGAFDDSGTGIFPKSSITVQIEESETNTRGEIVYFSPSVLFSDCTKEEHIDRLAAAAKSILRESRKA